MSGPDGSPEEPWLEARRLARAGVAAALAPRERTCPRCGAAQEATAKRRCARCGSELVAHRTRPRISRHGIAALVLGAVALGVPTVALVSESRDRAALEKRTAAAEQAALESSERRRQRREGRPRRAALPAPGGTGVSRERRRAVRATERLITADARARVRAGALDGPVIGTRCLPGPATSTRLALEDDPRAVRLPYDCVALKSRFEAPPDRGRRRIGLFGHPFRAVIDERRRTVTWCRVFPPAGEGGRSLAVVALDPACRGRVAAARARR